MFVVRLVLLVLLAAFAFAMATESGPLNAFGNVMAFSALLFVPALYLLPTYEAWRNQHRSLVPLALVNVFLGWTFLGWVGAYAWAFASKKDARPEPVYGWRHSLDTVPAAAPAIVRAPIPSASVADELRKLAELKRDGVLTEEEFAAQKAAVLGRKA